MHLCIGIFITSSLFIFFFQRQCSDFRAGDVLRSRLCYHALDETAVLRAICRHYLPIQMLSLFARRIRAWVVVAGKMKQREIRSQDVSYI